MIHAAGYDEDERELEVIFNDGGVYRSENVDTEKYEGLMVAGTRRAATCAPTSSTYPPTSSSTVIL